MLHSRLPLTLAAVLSLPMAAGLAQSATPVASASPAGSSTTPQVLTGDAKRTFDANAEQLRDFIHFIRIDRADAAAGVGRALLDKKIKPSDFVDLVERSGEQQRFENSAGKALQQPVLEPIAAQLLKLYDTGKLERVRNPEEIRRHIEMLKGVQRAKMIARDRLAAAGEYAMPQMLDALLKQDPEVRAEVSRIMIDRMGQQAVTPLCVALPQLDAPAQETVIDILGLIGYKTALPYIVDVMTSTSSSNVRAAADRAAGRLGLGSQGADAAGLYADLAEGYYAARPELTAFPREEFQLLWSYNPSIGLVMTAIRSEVFHEAMAMRLAERSMQLRPAGNDKALSLWLAANFTREIDTPKDYENPAYAPTRRDAMYYAVAAGASPSQQVLGRALDRRDSRLARRAIAAIEQTASGPALLSSAGGGQPPLAQALTFPNRRVQYDAALAMGKAQPAQSFGGSERVVPLLASAIRDAGTRYAVVISDNRELADGIRRTLEGKGYQTLPVGASIAELAQPIAETPGIDLVVASLPAEPMKNLITDVRGSSRMGATPVLGITSPQSAIDLARAYERDAGVAIRPSGISSEQIGTAAEALVEAASGGPINEQEAREYAARSLGTLRDLAISNSSVLNVGDAAAPLIASLEDGKGAPKVAVAEVLARINQKRAQSSLMDAAMGAKDIDRVALLNKVAESARRFGNLLEPRQIERAAELARTATGAEATAAAALLGSLNLQTNGIVPMILEGK